jgi:hypothetical protein
MRTRIKKIFVALLILAMAVTGMTGTGTNVQAAAVSVVKITGINEFNIIPGETNHIKLGVQSSNLQINYPTIAISQDDKEHFTFTTPTITYNGASLSSIYSFSACDLEFDVKVNEDAAIGSYPVTIKFSYYDFFTDSNTESSVTIYLIIQQEKVPAQLTVGNVKLSDSNLGSKTDLAFTIQNEGELTAKSVYLTMTYGDVIEERYTAKNIKVGDMSSGDTENITLPITILSTATTGRKAIKAIFTYKTADGDAKTSEYSFSVNLTSAPSVTQLPKINIDDISYTPGLKPEDNFSLTVDIKNIGGATAKNIKVDVDDANIDASGILKNYFTDGISVDSLTKDAERSVDIPLTVSKYSTGGLKAVKVIITYTDASGNSYTVSDTAYVDITAASATPTPMVGAPNILIKNVTQSPEQPQAGGKVEISFDVVNKGTVDAQELKILTDGLTTATFIPVDAEPYQYFEKLKAGDTIHVTIPLTVSKSIVEGLNSITVKYSYTGGDGSVSIPVRNVENNIVNISKPKIIVSNYTTDMEELRAGNTFNFTFDLYNTNATVAAKNITVTISQADNIFSVTQGSNSFFIEKMDPGETITKTLAMKVKNDASTKTYPLVITIEYEYDGIEANPTTGEIGEKRTETLNLQATENARPVVNNINVYSWDGNVTVGTAATLAFEFYNMGKSELDNVIAYVEGDLTKADGDMYFIGNVTAGSSSYVEFDVTPNIAGTANGKLRVTFEDSNGDTIENTYDFTAEVMDAGMVDNGGGVIPPDGSGEVFNPDAPMAKQAILPIWAFILVQIVIFALFVPVTRKIVISAYKAKLRRNEFD